jgi:multicomponent Na+:H+ antiporter subunit A
VVQGGPLHRHLFIVATVAIAAAATPLILFWEDPPLSGGEPFSIPEVLIILLGLASLALILLARNRLVMTAAAGITGFALAFLFAIYSAPDLAITQLMVETLMVILLVLVLHRLPPRVVRHSLPKRLVHAAVALAGGALVTVLLLLAAPAQFPADASEFYIRTTPDQHAGNLVNAILENFRAMDTLGEIAVLAIAGVGVAALVRLARDRHGGPDIAASGVAASSPPGRPDGDATETSEQATGPEAPAGPTGEPKEPSS